MEHKAEFIKNDLYYNGLLYAGNDAMGKLCRKLENGTLHVYRTGRIAMSVDVEARAKLSLAETDKGGLSYVKYKPFPEFMKTPAA